MTYRERALALFPAGSNGEYGIPAEVVPVIEVVMPELLRRGVFLNPMGSKLYPSLARTESAIEEFTNHFSSSLEATRPAKP